MNSPTVFYCNTSFDAVLQGPLSSGLYRITDPMSFLFIPLSSRPDIVLVKGEAPPDYLEYLSRCGINHGRIMLLDEYHDKKNRDYYIWGWDSQTTRIFPYADFPDISYVKQCNSRLFSSKIELAYGYTYAVPVKSYEHLKKICITGGYPVVVKPLFGSSAYNFIHIMRQEDIDEKMDLLKNVISKGCVAEKMHNRLFDFSYGYIHGFSNQPIFRELYNSNNGTFKSVTLSQHTSTLQGIKKSDILIMKKMYQHVQSELNLSGYSDSFGIDGYVYREEGEDRVRYVCEINCRKTMADICYYFMKKYTVPWIRLLSMPGSAFSIKGGYSAVFGELTFHAEKRRGVLFLSPVRFGEKGRRPSRIFLLLCGNSKYDLDYFEGIVKARR